MRIKLFANARSLSQSVPLYTAIMKYLNVAEKNDAAKNIALQLSRGTSRRREGLSQYNKIYEFEAEVMGQKCQMIMTSVSGHLLALDFVSSHKNWRTCSPLSLFEAPVKKFCPENYIKIKKTLEREVRGCQALIIWTDCDREGENIGFEIISVCQEVKRDLPVYRAKFSEITQISVQRALRNLEQPNKNISDAVEVRQELDLRIGAAFTRFQTLRLQKVFPSHLADKLVSYGSCQFPTLGFVVERYRAIENFVAEAFWKISVNHTQNNLSVNFTWERGRLFDQDACQVLYNIVMENPLAKVVKIKTQPKSKWRPLPLDTVELEKLASRKLKINAKETMRLAEKLYTQGYISYPRTETNQYPKELDLGSLVQLQAGHADWGAFAGRVLAAGPAPRRGTKTDNAHPPIHPTKFADNTTLSGNEYRLYEFIVRSFLACCSKDAEGQETIVTVEISKEIFTANGLMITALNYLEVYPYEKWSSKEIHLYQMGDTFNPSSIDMTEGATSPPNLLTEADLIALMEKHGIGTDATHAEHIETIKKREYVSLARGGFVPGVLGMGLVGGYDAMGLALARPQLRARLEAALAAVCAARRPAAAVLADQLEIYKETFITVMEQANKIDESLSLLLREQPIEYIPSVESLPVNTPSALKCPKCGADMAIRPKKNCEEFYIGCQSFPSCRNAVWFPAVVKTVQVLPETCPMCGSNYHKMKFEWRNNSLSHMYPPPYVGCIGGCDTAFLEHLSINLSSVRKVPATTSNSTQSTVNSTNRPNNSTTSRDSTFDSTRNNRSTWPIDNSYPAPTQNASSSNVSRVQNSMPSGSRQPTSNRMNGNGVQSSPNSEDNAIMCLCNKQAILLTVRKQNENCGRQFYKCQVGKDNGGCDFFSWATQAGDAQPQSNSNTTTSATASNSSWGSNSTNNNNSMNSGQGWNTTRQDTPNDGGAVCNCGLPCKQLTVRKEGPNQGRAFYSCSKDFNSRCNFFEWADVPSGTSNNWGGAEGSGRGGGSWRGRGGLRGGARGGSRAGAPRGGSRGGAHGEPRGGSRGGPRLCGLCRQEGHTRNRCPQRQDD